MPFTTIEDYSNSEIVMKQPHSMPLISSVKEEAVLEDRKTSSRLEDVKNNTKSNLNTGEREAEKWDIFSGIKDTEEVSDGEEGEE